MKKAGIYRQYQNWSMRRKQKRDLEEWERGERAAIPHLVKQQVLKEYANRYGLRILVETGTLHGDMVEVMKDSFKKVFSIELSEDLYKEAVERFACDDNVELIQGDSGVELEKIVNIVRSFTIQHLTSKTWQIIDKNDHNVKNNESKHPFYLLGEIFHFF